MGQGPMSVIWRNASRPMQWPELMRLGESGMRLEGYFTLHLREGSFLDNFDPDGERFLAAVNGVYSNL